MEIKQQVNSSVQVGLGSASSYIAHMFSPLGPIVHNITFYSPSSLMQEQ